MSRRHWVLTLLWAFAVLAAGRALAQSQSAATPGQEGEGESADLATIPLASEAGRETPGEASPRSELMAEIVVTAQKREEALQDVPISISAFSGDTLSALGVVDTADLSGLVPGFTYSDSGFGSPVYTLRGVGFTDGSFTASSTVGVYVDEVNLPFSILTKGANLDLARVEVLKGPQGTLYGRNTTGGAVNYIARKPTKEFETGAEVSYGRFETTQIEGFVSGPITNTLRGRFAALDLRSQKGCSRA